MQTEPIDLCGATIRSAGHRRRERSPALMPLLMSLTLTLWLTARDHRRGRRRPRCRPHLRDHHPPLYPKRLDTRIRCRTPSHQVLRSHTRTVNRPAARQQLHRTGRGRTMRKIPTSLHLSRSSSNPTRPLSTIRNRNHLVPHGLGLRCPALLLQSI